MKNNVIINSNVNGQFYSDQVLKLTSLIYLKEALSAQQYENCAALIREAKGFGALQNEISALIAEVFGSPKANAQEEKTGQNRSRF